MKEAWLMSGAVVPVDVETTSALLAEIKRLIDMVGGLVLAQPEQEPVAWISKHGVVYPLDAKDEVHPINDLQPLYTTPPAAPVQEPVAHPIIAGALFDFMGWLTSRPKRIMLSSADEASPAVDAIKEFAKMRGLSLDDARVQDWQDTTPPAAQRQPLPFAQVCEIEEVVTRKDGRFSLLRFARAIEAAHGITGEKK